MTEDVPFDFDAPRQQERYEYKRKPRKCPACGSTRVASVLYGMPAFSPELERKMKEGKITLGGCCIGLDDPKWECADCHLRMHKLFAPDSAHA